MEDFYGKKIRKNRKKNFENFSRIFFHRRRPSRKATEGSQKASFSEHKKMGFFFFCKHWQVAKSTSWVKCAARSVRMLITLNSSFHWIYIIAKYAIVYGWWHFLQSFMIWTSAKDKHYGDLDFLANSNFIFQLTLTIVCTVFAYKSHKN